MKIHLLTGLMQGGAAAAAKQLTLALDQSGIDAKLFFPEKYLRQRDPQHAQRFLPARWPMPWHRRFTNAVGYRLHRIQFKRIAARRPKGHEIFTSPFGTGHTPWPPVGSQSPTELLSPEEARRGSAKAPWQPNDALLHLHWVARMIHYPSFFGSLAPGQPVVWTLHDMNALSGGCHFSEGCEQFTTGCERCPQLAAQDHEFAANAFRTKLGALKDIQLHIVTPGRWLADFARRSPILGHAQSIHQIPYGLPPESHAAAMPRDQARRELGIDPDTFVFSFGAADVRNQRKGARFLPPALARLANDCSRKVHGFVLGDGEMGDLAVPVERMGFVKSIDERMRLYAASDVFIIPSIDDNMPLTGIEAMVGGAALLGFRLSGIPDLIRDGETGRLAAPADGEDLGKTLVEMANQIDATRHQGARAQEIAKTVHVAAREAECYAQLYHAIAAQDGSEKRLPTAVNH